ncbi:hypothetical protein [Marinimicrobium sp. ABcell2]|uniref:hypothetical protein n=1 Tax=Marinimicrobium sp. ABcell2 TaxID=3069751 RepID=UPI0027B7B863|nr:hypothetical protein [Marinimicrobium sp. ABcell2]MDQ2075470.1 hypothetical protein [Marinimicrobium sp. ABcell2]
MSIKRSLLLITVFLSSPYLFSFELEKAVTADGGQSVRSDEERAASPIITKTIQKVYSRKDTGLGLAHTNLGGGDVWFRLYRNMTIYAVDVNDEKIVGAWPLTRWRHDQYFPEEVLKRYRDYGNHADPDELRQLGVGSKTLGCLPQTPLRYGDFNGDGNSELVIFFANDIVVFSPSQGRVIFSQNLRVDEWLDKEETQYYIDNVFFGEVPGDTGQYMSKISAEAVRPRGGILNYILPAYRGYGKLFLGDFNENGQSDILVWHKFYQSFTVADATEGFEHLYDTWLHYAWVDGEYQPQETNETTIRGWLAANELTWQKGYPSKSECEGEEGELIPEMHDPLLNDPDVLQ